MKISETLLEYKTIIIIVAIILFLLLGGISLIVSALSLFLKITIPLLLIVGLIYLVKTYYFKDKSTNDTDTDAAVEETTETTTTDTTTDSSAAVEEKT